MDRLTVASYNLWNNGAQSELPALASAHRPDVLCLQECDHQTLTPTIGTLRRAASTERNRLGLAIYHDEERFDSLDTAVFTLPKSAHDYVMSPCEERLLAVDLQDRRTGERLVVASFHAAPLTTWNAVRRRQIGVSHQFLSDWAPGVPMLMVGDYNYPLFRRGLQRFLDQSGHAATFSESHTYKRYRYLKGHFDFVTSLGIEVDRVVSLPKGVSDHLPILVEAHVESTAPNDPAPAPLIAG